MYFFHNSPSAKPQAGIIQEQFGGWGCTMTTLMQEIRYIMSPKAKKKESAPKKKKEAASKARSSSEPAPDSSEFIEAQTAAFLKAGGKVDVIPSGVSGQQSMAAGRKHITLGNSNNKSGG